MQNITRNMQKKYVKKYANPFSICRILTGVYSAYFAYIYIYTPHFADVVTVPTLTNESTIRDLRARARHSPGNPQWYCTPWAHGVVLPQRRLRYPAPISKLRGYYIILFLFGSIIRIRTLLKHIMTLLLFHLFHLQFLDYYVILYQFPEISYYINYITSIISIIFI
jgi:hypothetical protein